MRAIIPWDAVHSSLSARHGRKAFSRAIILDGTPQREAGGADSRRVEGEALLGDIIIP